MSTLEHRLKDPDYKNWVKTGLCLALVKKGLEEYAEIKSKEFHDAVLASVAKIQTYQKAICDNESITFNNNNNGKIACNHVFCQGFLNEVVNLGIDPTQKFKIRRANIENCDVKLWPNDHWELAKLFMNQRQKPCQTNPSQTDLSGILNFLEHCQVPRNGIQNTQHIDEVRQTINSVMHTPDMKVSPAMFQTDTQTMLDLLRDPNLAKLSSAKHAESEIQKVIQADFQILLEDEITVIKNWKTALEKVTNDAKTEIRELRKEFTSMQQTGYEEKKTLQALIQQMEGEINKIADSLAALTKRVSDDKTLQEKIGLEVKNIHVSQEKARKDLWKADNKLKRGVNEIEQKNMDAAQERTVLYDRHAKLELRVSASISDLSVRQANIESEAHEMKRRQDNLEQKVIFAEQKRMFLYDRQTEMESRVEAIMPAAIGDELDEDAWLTETSLRKCIWLSIGMKHRVLMRYLLNEACSVIQKKDSKIIEVWPAYQKGQEWEPILVVLSEECYKGEYSSFLGIKLYKRKRSYVNREAAIVSHCQKVKDNPLRLADFDRLSYLFHKADLFTKHRNITFISASPCRSRKFGREISIEKCIVIHCLVKGLIPFDEEPFPEKISGIPVDVREGYFTFGGKIDKPRRSAKERSPYSSLSNIRVHKSTPLLHLKTKPSDTASSIPDAAHKYLNNMKWTKGSDIDKWTLCDIYKRVTFNPRHGVGALALKTLIEDFTSKCSLTGKKGTELRIPSIILPNNFMAPSSYTPSQSELLLPEPVPGQLNSSNLYSAESGDISYRSFLREDSKDGNNLLHGKSTRNLEDNISLTNTSSASTITHTLDNPQPAKTARRSLQSSQKKYRGKYGERPHGILVRGRISKNVRFLCRATRTNKARDWKAAAAAAAKALENKKVEKRDKKSNMFRIADSRKPLEFNRTLLMGTGIGLSGSSLRGTLGGFVQHEDGTLCFLTCAHVIGHESGVADENINRLVCQPADADTPSQQRFKPENADPETQRRFKRTVCGHVYKAVFYPGNKDSVSVDAALVAIDSRRPNRAEFRWVRDDQLMDSGFDPSSPPHFMKGNILTCEDLKNPEIRLKDVIKIGAETGLSKGSIVMVGTDVRKLNKKEITMKTPNDKPVTFYRQIEISPDEAVSFFDLGDSGSLVFMQIGSELHCIGMAIGITHPQRTCIVTPIKSVFEKLGLPEDTKFVDFTDNIE